MASIDIVPRMMAMNIILIASLCTSQAFASLDVIDYGGSTADPMDLLQLTSTYCPTGQIFCFDRNKCVMQDGSCVPGEEPSCMAEDQEVCYVDGQFICAGRDDCIHTDVKFALFEHRSVTDFLNDYARLKQHIESSLEVAFGATAFQIYAVRLHRMDDGTIFVTARADRQLQPMLDRMFEERQQFVQDSYGDNIGIDWERIYSTEGADPVRTECGPYQSFCFLTGRCVDDGVTMETPCDHGDEEHDIPPEHCHQGQTFCFLTGRCVDDTVTMETPCGENDYLSPSYDYSPTEFCPFGQKFCFLTGRCVDEAVTMATPCVEREDYYPPYDYSATENCHHGQRFCFVTGRCVDEAVTMATPCGGSEDYYPSYDYSPKENCHHGQRFCFLTGRCVDEAVTMATPCGEREDYYPPYDYSPTENCYNGQRFCFLSGQCVDEAVTMETPCGEREDYYPPYDYSSKENCHNGQRFCFLSGQCVDEGVTMETPCGEREDYYPPYDYSPREYCHSGQTFCFLTGRCIDNHINMDDTCPCDMGMSKCYSDDTKTCKWGHECQYKQAIVTAEGDFSMVEHSTDELVYLNTEVLKMQAGLKELQYLYVYPGSIMFAIRTSDIRILSELPRLIQNLRFPLDMNGDPMNVLEYKVWDEWSYEGEHKLKSNGEWIDYEYPTHCYEGQRFCFMSGQCVSDVVVPELDGGCSCSYGQVKCVKDEKVECVDYDQCTYVWTVLEMEGEFSSIEDSLEVLREKAWASLQEFGIKHVQDLNFYSGSIMLSIRSSDMKTPEIVLRAVNDGRFPLGLDDTPFNVRSLTYGYEKSEEVTVYYSNGEGLVKYEEQKQTCRLGETFCFLTDKCIDNTNICDDCVQKGDCGETPEKPNGEFPKEHCLAGQTFCFLTGKCMADTNPCLGCEQTNDCPISTESPEGPKVEAPIEHCYPGQFFCFVTGKCIDDVCEEKCAEGQVMCVSRANQCSDIADCPISTISITFDADFNTVVGADVSAYNTFLLGLLSTWVPRESVIDIVTTSGSIKSTVKSTAPADDINIMITAMEEDTGESIEYNGHALNNPVIVLMDESIEDMKCLIPETPFWCESSKMCVAEGQCDVVTEKDVFIIWATLSEEHSFLELVAPDTSGPLEDQITAFKTSTTSTLQTIFETTGLTFTGVSVLPGDRDGRSTTIVAVAEANSDAMTPTAIQTVLTNANIGPNMQITEVDVWLTLGLGAPVQIFPSTVPLIYNKDVSVDLTFLPNELLAISSTLTLDCSAEDGISIKVNDEYSQEAELASNTLTMKVTIETTKFAKCEIVNIPTDIKGTKPYYVGFIVLMGDPADLSKIDSITATNISIAEDSGCQDFPANLFTLEYKGDAMMELFFQPKWPQRMIDAQESWVTPLRVVQTMERMLQQFIEGVLRRRASLRVTVALRERIENVFNSEKMVKFRYLGTNLETIENRPQVLSRPQDFQYCIAGEFSGTLQLHLTHLPSINDAAVTTSINIQVNPSNDRPVIRNDAEDITSEFSYPKVSGTNPGPEFNAHDLAALWYTDVDMETDSNAQMGVGILGAVTQATTVGGQWEYISSPSDTVWKPISDAPSGLDQTAENSIQVLLLQRDARLRFVPESEYVEDTWEITRSPSLALFAWDESNIASLTDLSQTPLIIRKCRKSVLESLDMFCVDGNAYSREIKLVSLPRDGCDDIPGSGMVATQCGCGKTAESCVDCNNIVNGEAGIDKCGICSGGQTGLVQNTEVNCDDETCRSNNLDYCEKKEAAVSSISSLCSESKRPNQCYNRSCSLYDMCTEETDVPVDACDVQCGCNACLDCEGVPNGGKVLNPCGQCKDPASLFEGCEGLGGILPSLSFTHAMVNMSVRVSDGIVASPTTPINCQLVAEDPIEGQIVPEVKDIKYEAGVIMFTTKVMTENKANSAGVFSVRCDIDGTVLSSADTGQLYTRYNNPTLSTLVPEQLTSGTEMAITITGTGFLDTGEIFCVIPYDNGEYLYVSGTRVTDMEVTCDVGKLASKLWGTSYDVFVILDKPLTMRQELASLTNPLSFTVKLPAPSPVSAKFSVKDCRRIDIKFNDRISGPASATEDDCSTYFDDASMAIIQADASCKIFGGKLVLITTVTVPVNTELNLRNIKREKESSTTPNFFTGLVMITEDGDSEPPDIYINPGVSDTVGCKAQRVNVIVKNKQCWNVEITWTASVEDVSDSAVQDKLNILNAFLANKQEFKLEKDQLVEAPVTFTATWILREERTGNEVTGSESVVIQKDDSIALAILNVDKTMPARQALRPQGIIKGCITDSEADISPSWTLKPDGIYNRFPPNKLRVIIGQGILPENTEFNLTLTVSIGAKTYSKSVIFMTSPIPPEAAIEYQGAIASEKVEVINGQDHQLICINVAVNADPNAPTNYIWTGMDNRFTDELSPIIDPSSSTIKRLEVTTAELSLSSDQFKGEDLIQEWTCEIQQGQLSSEASTILKYKEVSTLPTPVTRSRLPSGRRIQIYEGEQTLKIRAFCQYTTHFEWFSSIETEEEMLITGIKSGTIINDNNDDRFRPCGVKIDLSSLELSPDVDYPLSLKAVNERDGQEVTKYLDLTFEYVTKPIAGTVEAVYEGDTITAYTGLVSIGLDNWDTEGGDVTDLKCKIYYRKSGLNRKRRLTTSYISPLDFVEDVTFPAGEFIVEATCCNPIDLNKLCTTVAMVDTLVAIQAAEPTNFLSFLDNIFIKMKTGDRTFVAALIGVMTDPSLSSEEKEKSDEIALTGISDELRYVKDVTNIDPRTSLDALVNINDIAETAVTIDDETKSDIQAVVKDTAKALTGQGPTPIKIIQDDKGAGGRRRKRDTTVSTAAGMTVSTAEVLLGTFDNLISGDPVGKETAEAFKEVIDLALLGLCQAYSGDTPWVAGSEYTTTRVTQITLEGQATTEYDVSCSSCASVTYPAKVVYGEDIVSQYGDTEICVSTGQILVDTITPTGTDIERTRMSDLVILKLINLDGFSTETVTGLTSQSVKVSLTLNNSTINSTAYDYVCKMWSSVGQWSDSECSASNPVLDSGTSKYSVQCSCNALGTVGIFRELKPDDSISITTPSPSTTTTPTRTTTTETTTTVTMTTAAPSVPLTSATKYVNVGWTFSNSFGTEVSDETTFKSNLKTQLSTKFGISSASCRNLEIKSGSILVSFELHAYSSSSQTLGQMLYSLQNGIGTITLTNSNGNSLVVQSGTFYYQEVKDNDSGDSDKKNGNLGIIIGAAFGGLIIGGIVVVAVVYMVKKYAKPKTHPVSNHSTGAQGYDAPPAYVEPAYGAPPPPPYLYTTPTAPEPLRPYPVSNKWMENELSQGRKPMEGGSRPNSRESTNGLLSEKKAPTTEPTPVG